MTRKILLPAAIAALALCTAAARAAMNFPETANLTWSSDKMTNSPENELKFHGDFSNEAVTASLDKLPAHDYLQITVELIILRSWDGVARTNGGPRMGPDYIRIGLDDGRTLLQNSFSNMPVMSGFDRTSNFQGYPSPVPGEKAPYMTGADFKNMFGYNFPAIGPQPPIAVHQDAIYTLKMTIPHTAAKVALHFRGMGLQEIADESWGVAGVQMVPRTKAQFHPAVADEKDVYDTFTDGQGVEMKMLALPSYGRLLQVATGHEAVAANEAFWRLVSAGDNTVAYLTANVPGVAVDAAKVKELAAAVYADAAPADETDPRIQAILKLGITAEPVLRDLRQEAKESPTRLDWALMETNMLTVDDPDLRQWIVAMRILEAIGTPEAKKARAALMNGAGK